MEGLSKSFKKFIIKIIKIKKNQTENQNIKSKQKLIKRIYI